MNANVGNIDRTARVTLGLIIIGLGLFYQSYWGLIGLVPLITAYLRWCPAYLPFGISTCKRRN